MTFRLEDPFDETDGRVALHNIARQIRDAEETHAKRVNEAGEAESAYRKGLAIAMVTHRAQGKGAGEAEVLAKGDCADLKRDALIAAGMVRASLEELEDRRGDRASLHRLLELSMRVLERPAPDGMTFGRRAA